MANPISFPPPDLFEVAVTPFLTLDDLTAAEQVSRAWKKVFGAPDVWAAQAKRFAEFKELPDPKRRMLTVPQSGFGKSEWVNYFGDPGDIRLPREIRARLENPCPFWPGKKIKETHLLSYVPPKLVREGTEVPFNLGNLCAWAAQAKKGAGVEWRSLWTHLADGFKGLSLEKGQWVLMTKEIVPGTKDKTFDLQKEIVEQAGYQVPHLLGAAICIIGEFLTSGKRCFSFESRTFTRCQEISTCKSQKYHLVVGGFNDESLGLYRDEFELAGIGMAGMLIFPENPRL